MWHMTFKHDIWHMVGVKHYLKISASQLSWCLEDSEQKNEWMNELMNDWMLIMCSCELYILCFDHLNLFKVAIKNMQCSTRHMGQQINKFHVYTICWHKQPSATKHSNFDIKCHGSEWPGYFKTNVGVVIFLYFSLEDFSTEENSLVVTGCPLF